jgi:hypothetical protein
MTQTQPEWHFCLKCSNMQWNTGAPGMCLGVGQGNHGLSDHKSQGYNFILPYGGEQTATQDRNFFFCSKCHCMFQQQDFGTGDDLGKCPKGGQHDRTDSFNFALPHDVPVDNGQDKWVVCVNCNVLYYGPADPQKCAAPGALSHSPGQGRAPNYNLPHGDFDA